MSPLAVILADPTRVGLAVELVMATAALGGEALLYLHAAAVPGAREPLIGEALAAGVRVIVCQTGLAEAGLAFADLSEGVEAGGLVSLLAEAGAYRLVVV